MIDQTVLLAIALLYIFLLFLVAWQASIRKSWLQSSRPYIYALALAVYCSSWTFFGAVGQANSNLWSFLPIYLGPMFAFIFGYGFLQKLLIVGEQQKVTSIADFIGSRYGKNQALSALVTLLSIAGSLPYIALQLRAVTMAWETLSPVTPDNEASLGLDSALIAALIMGVFAILFGTRNLAGRERNRGMVTAIALESLIKIIAFAAISIAAVWLLLSIDTDNITAALPNGWMQANIDLNFVTQTVLATLAIFCLPRQFHMLVVEYQDQRDLRTARWILPLYLTAFSLFVIPIAFSAHLLFNQSNLSPDSLALSLPVLAGYPSLSVLAFIGGLSAATGMVIVASITLAVMISNEIVAPLWLRISRSASISIVALGDNLKLIRRISIFAILLLAWWVNKAFINIEGLTAIGLLAFAASAQLAPALIIGLYWRGAHRNGAIVGLSVGYLTWFFCLIFPVFCPSSPINEVGLFNISWLRPEQLFFIKFPDPLAHGVFWSLMFNILLLVFISHFSKKKSKDLKQAEAFTSETSNLIKNTAPPSTEHALSSIQVRQLQNALSPFVEATRLDNLWQNYELESNQHLLADDMTPVFIVEAAEKTLASILGSATAHKVIKMAYKKQPLQLQDIAELVDDTSKKLRFSQSILQNTVETINQAISVVDADLCLIAWNSKYQAMFSYPKHLLYIGCPIVQLHRVNVERGWYGDDIEEIELEVERRLALIRLGKPYHFTRDLPNGRIIDVHSNPMAGGGFVTSYSDITEHRSMLDALEESKTNLEKRVASRTAALSNANQALQKENQKRAEIEARLKELHEVKSSFLAHTSHDLMQPLNAARLFIGVLQQKMTNTGDSEITEDLNNIDHALNNAEDLVDALREISHLDSGNLVPKAEHFSVHELLDSLVLEFNLLLNSDVLELHYQPNSALVNCDRHLLRRVLQNFLSNAFRYTKRGRILLGCRRRQDKLEIQVWDTGPGISTSSQQSIFDEFVRLDKLQHNFQGGLGLGLTIAKRSSELMHCPIDLISKEGHGSMFSITVPLSAKLELQSNPDQHSQINAEPNIFNIRVLCIDNDETILKAMQALLKIWGCQVEVASRFNSALNLGLTISAPDIIIMDYHLDQENNGVDCLLSLNENWSSPPPAILISADISEPIRTLVNQYNLSFLSKPVKPASLLNVMRQLVNRAKTKQS